MSDTLTNALAQSAHSSNVLQGIMNPAQINPLAGYGSAISAVQGMQGLADSYAKQRLGEAFQQAVDPATGRLDPLKFNQLVAADPATARAAQSGMESSQRLQGEQLTQNTATQGVINGAVSAALAEKDDSKLPGIVVQQAQRLIDAGIPRDRVMASLLNLSSDPAQMRQQLQTIYTQTAPPELGQALRFGQPFRQTGPGGATVGGMQSITTGAVSGPAGGQSGLPLGQSPEDLNAIVQIGTNSDGSARMGTKRQARNLAEGRDANDDGPHAAGGTGAAGPLGTGRPPASLLNPNKPQAATQPPATAPGFTTGLGPAATSAQGATGTASAGKFQDIVAQGVAARSQDALLATMLSEAQGFRPGPGADLAATIKRTILGLGAQFGTTFGVDTDKLAKQESVAKIGNQLADAQGAGSDARLRVNEGANPSLHNTPAGLDLIIRQLRGNTDYLRIRQQLAAAYPDKADVEGFESKIGANLDPRVFQYERLQPSQKADYYNGLTDKAAFRKAHDWAAAQKLIGGGGG